MLNRKEKKQDLDGLKYSVKEDGRARRIILTVSDGKVEVTKPPYVPVEEVNKFVGSNRDWILERLREQKKVWGEMSPGVKLPYRGRRLVLKPFVIGCGQIRIDYKDGVVYLYLPRSISEEERQERIYQKLRWWYRKRAREVFTERLGHFAAIMNLKYNRLRVKDQKTRWGSCSRKGNINLNWRLILAPSSVIDYVIIHELLHLKHMNHSADFWKDLAGFLPDYKLQRNWLKENGKKLTL